MSRTKYLCILFLLLLSGTTFGQTITTIAGNGAHGFYGDGGAATDASFDFPCNVHTDRHGNILIADFWDARIRKIDPATGNIMTIAGNGTFVNTGDGGPATNAGINCPMAIATDTHGNIYIACDSVTNAGTIYYVNQGCYVRKIDTSGIITTIAGNGSAIFGGDGGLATAAGINQAYGLGGDTSGNIYIPEISGRIRKITPSGIITTITGDGTPAYTGDGGPATAARVMVVGDVIPDKKGNLFFTDGDRIRKIDAAGIMHTIAGNDSSGCTGDGGPASAARLKHAHGLAMDDSGNIYFSDVLCNVIRKINQAGIISTIAGNGIRGYSGDGGRPDSAQINSVYGLAIDGTGNLYLSDVQNENIRMVCPKCTPVSTSVISQLNATLTIRTMNGYGQFSLQYNSSNLSPARIYITNMVGGKIMETECLPGKELQLNLNVPSGIYLVTANNGIEMARVKILVR